MANADLIVPDASLLGSYRCELVIQRRREMKQDGEWAYNNFESSGKLSSPRLRSSERAIVTVDCNCGYGRRKELDERSSLSPAFVGRTRSVVLVDTWELYVGIPDSLEGVEDNDGRAD